MIMKNQIQNSLYLIISLIAFSFSLFKWDNQVWIAAWIAPVFLIRFMRKNKWGPAVIFGFLVLLLSYILGFIPTFASFNMESNLFIHVINFIVAVLTALFFLTPFILDKILYNKLPKLVSSLIFPAGFVTIELLLSFFQGTLFCFGQSQYAISPLVMIASVFGIFCLSFLKVRFYFFHSFPP